MRKMMWDVCVYIASFPRFIYGLWKLSRLQQPIITIFGGRNVPAHHDYYKMAYELGMSLAKQGYSIITGGGPGIMDAALCGVRAYGKKNNVLGVEVLGVDTFFTSSCGVPAIKLPNFALRKMLLMQYSSAYIVFPGGIGTLDELADLFNLIKTKKIPKKKVILMFKNYWKPFDEWMHAALLQGLIPIGFEELYIFADTVQDVERFLTFL